MHYVQHLSKDKKLKKLIQHHGHFKLKKQKDLCLYLCHSIISQQLSTKVASVIQQRFLNLYDDLPTPQHIIDTPFEKLSGVGMSNAKANYVQNVARFEMEFGMHHTKLHKMSNDEVIEYLTQIKGVGRWTTEMLLMFALCREDVFAIDDLGIRNAMLRLYEIKTKDKKKQNKELLRISESWSPYRTYACMYMWRSLDNPQAGKKATKKKKMT